MRRLLLALLALTAAVVTAGSAAAAGSDSFALTRVGRLPFPERGYVVDVPAGSRLGARDVRITENGAPVDGVTLQPLAGSGVRYGVVLAIDASESMRGAPFTAAIEAARRFVEHQAPGERIAIVAFNGSVHVLHGLTLDRRELLATLARPSHLSQGTKIVDALDAALGVLVREHVAAGSIVLLSDGTDVGSVHTPSHVVTAARGRHVRIFTVGLQSKSFDRSSLESVARATGGAYAEASSTADLASIYDALGQRLATSFVVRYRSSAAPKTHVDVRVTAGGLGDVGDAYVAPAPSLLAPYHRSLLSSFLLSWVSLALLAIVGAAAAGLALNMLLTRNRSGVVDRITAFIPGRTAPAAAPRTIRPAAVAPALLGRRGWFMRLERDFDIARIETDPARAILLTGAVTAASAVLLFAVSPILALLALLIPVYGRATVGRRVRAARSEFAEQLPPNLQVLAAALRAGHSLLGAISSTVENAHEPSRGELARVVADERLGVPIEDSIRRVAERMKCRDLEQVALLAELARTTGGNSAEVLDVVVGTIRERADLRRLVRTLTAQGRLARWILTGLPIACGLGFYVIQPDVMSPMLHSAFGQVLVVVAACMVFAGSLVIQRIVDIEI